MAKQTINIGTSELAGDGESIRSAFGKINSNFDEVYSDIATLDGSKIELGNLSVTTASASGAGSLSYDNITGVFTFTPAAAGFSGDYNDLTNKPAIPADIGDLTDTGNLLTTGTGDITFDGIKIQGAGTASGDGNGYSTIELVPDADLYANDQYLVIDPTEPSHIHIRAGGTQDASAASLFLGGEKNYVRVIDDSGVRLYNEVRDDTFSYFQEPADFNTATWYGTPGNYFVQFTEVTAGMGDLAFQFGNDDENRVTVYYGASESSVLTYGGSASNLGGGVYRFAVVEAPPSSPTALTAIEFQIWNTRNNRVELQNNDFTVVVTDDIRIEAADSFRLINNSATAPIRIITNDDNASYTWSFGANGTLTFPDNSVQSTAYTGNYNDLTNKPTIPTVPTAVSAFTNDSGYITGYTVTESDVTTHQGALSITESQISDLGNYVESDTTGITGADAVTNIVSLTQAEYDAIVTPNASTVYIIVG